MMRTDMDVLVSVIVPVYNAEKYISRCIESLQNQTYRNLEIILVDDGSQDRSGVICDEYSATDSRIRVFHIENGGVSIARNVGLEAFNGEWFSFVDSDDFVSEYYIEHLLDSAGSCNVDIATSRPFVTPETDSVVLPPVEKRMPQIIELAEYVSFSYGVVWGGIYHRAILGETRFQTDLFYGEDTLFFFELSYKMKSIAFLDEKLYCYIQHPASLSRGHFDEKKFTLIKACERMCEIFTGTGLYAAFRECLGFAAMNSVYSFLEENFDNKMIYKKLVKTIRKQVWYVLRSDRSFSQKKLFLLTSISPKIYYRTRLIKTE